MYTCDITAPYSFPYGTRPRYNIIIANCPICNNSYTFVRTEDTGWLLELIYPHIETFGPDPLEEMPEDAKSIYNEARGVALRSPRAAAALLRLALQFLLDHFEPDENTIHEKIKKMSSDGRLSADIQEACGALRGIGNEAAHNKTIRADVSDNSETVKFLFDLLNYIVDKLIVEPQKRRGLCEARPRPDEEAKKQ